jgi:hypothetical protein
MNKKLVEKIGLNFLKMFHDVRGVKNEVYKNLQVYL